MNRPPQRPVHRGESARRDAAGRDAERSRLADVVAAGLGFLAADPERLDRFFALTGLSVMSLRHSAAQPGFAESVLDYLAADERLYLAFAREAGYDPVEVEALRMSLVPHPPEF